MKTRKGSYRSSNGWLWENFQLHELIDIVRQAVTQILLNCLIGFERFKKHDAIQIKGLANNNTAT